MSLITPSTMSLICGGWLLAKQFAFPRPAVTLHTIAQGCIGIRWLIPANLVNYITRMAREKANMFAEVQILTVMLEKQCIYPMEIKPHITGD